MERLFFLQGWPHLRRLAGEVKISANLASTTECVIVKIVSYLIQLVA